MITGQLAHDRDDLTKLNTPALSNEIDQWRGLGFTDSQINGHIDKLSNEFTRLGISFEDQNAYFGRTPQSHQAYIDGYNEKVIKPMANHMGIDYETALEAGQMARMIPGVSPSLYASDEKYRKRVQDHLYDKMGYSRHTTTWEQFKLAFEQDNINMYKSYRYWANALGTAIGISTPLDPENDAGIKQSNDRLFEIQKKLPIKPSFWEEMAQGTGSLIPQMIPTLAAGLATGGTGAAAVSFINSSIREGGAMYEESLEQGIEPGVAAGTSLVYGAASGMVEAVEMAMLAKVFGEPLKYFGNKVTKRVLGRELWNAGKNVVGEVAEDVTDATVRGALKNPKVAPKLHKELLPVFTRFGLGTGIEVTQEMAQRGIILTGINVGRIRSGLEPKSWEEIKGEMLEEGRAALPGMLGLNLLGLPFGTAMAFSRHRFNTKTFTLSQKIDELEEKRASGELDAEAQIETGNKVVFIAKNLIDVLFQRKNLNEEDRQRAIRELGLDPEEYDKAHENEEIAIAKKLFENATKHENMKDIRIQAREAAETLSYTKYLKRLQQQLDALIADPLEQDTNMAAEARALRDDLNRQLILARGRDGMSDEEKGNLAIEAMASSTLYARMALIVARATGQRPGDVAAIQVLRGTPELLEQLQEQGDALNQMWRYEQGENIEDIASLEQMLDDMTVTDENGNISYDPMRIFEPFEYKDDELIEERLDPNNPEHKAAYGKVNRKPGYKLKDKYRGKRPAGYKPSKTGKSYKLMVLHPDGTIHPLFAGAEDVAVKLGEWMWADGYEPTDSKQVLEMGLSPRYAWHFNSSAPTAPHLMSPNSPTYPSKSPHPKGSVRVWVETEYDASQDFTEVAQKGPNRDHDFLGLMPFGGFYTMREKNGSKWVLSSGMRFVRILGDESIPADLREKLGITNINERKEMLKEMGIDENKLWLYELVFNKMGIKKLQQSLADIDKSISQIDDGKTPTLKAYKEMSREQLVELRKKNESALENKMAEFREMEKMYISDALYQQEQNEQTGEEKTLGAWWKEGETNIVALFKDADASTFVHEMGHIMFNMLQEMSKLNDVDPMFKKDFENALAWMGIDPNEAITKEKHEQQLEKFADGFLKYLYEGKNPPPKLRQFFNWFKIQLYRFLGIAKLNNIELSDDVRKIYDHMTQFQAEYDRSMRMAEVVTAQEINRRIWENSELDYWRSILGDKVDDKRDIISDFYWNLHYNEELMRDGTLAIQQKLAAIDEQIAELGRELDPTAVDYTDKVKAMEAKKQELLAQRAKIEKSKPERASQRDIMRYRRRKVNQFVKALLGSTLQETFRELRKMKREAEKGAEYKEKYQKKVEELKALRQKMRDFKKEFSNKLEEYKKANREGLKVSKMIRMLRRMCHSDSITAARRQEIKERVAAIDMRGRPRGYVPTEQDLRDREVMRQFMNMNPDATDAEKSEFSRINSGRSQDWKHLDQTPLSTLTYEEFEMFYNEMTALYQLGKQERKAELAKSKAVTMAVNKRLLQEVDSAVGRKPVILSGEDAHKSYRWGAGHQDAIRAAQQARKEAVEESILARTMDGETVSDEERSSMIDNAMVEGMRQVEEQGSLYRIARNIKRSSEYITDKIQDLLLDRHSFFDWLSGGNARFDTVMYALMVRKTNRCQDAVYTNVERRIGEAVQQRWAEETGFDTAWLSDRVDLAQIDPTLHAYLQGRQMTFADMLGFLLVSKDPRAARHAIHGNLNGLPMNKREELFNRIINGEFCQDKARWEAGKKWVDKIFEVLGDKDAFNRMNKVHVYLTNKYVDKEDQYVSIFTLERSRNFNELVDPTQSTGQQKFLKDDNTLKSPPTPGFTISRTDIKDENQGAIVLNPVTILTRHVQAEEHYIAYGRHLKQIYDLLALNDVSGRNSLSHAIDKKFGRTTLQTFLRFYNEMAVPSVFKAEDAFDSLVGRFARNTAIGALAMNLGVIMKNFVSIGKWFLDANPVEVFSALTDWLANPRDFMQRVYELDPHIMARRGNPLFELRANDPNTPATRWNRLLNRAIEVNATIDRWTSAIMFMSVYNSQMRIEGMTPGRAAALAQESVQRNMQPASYRELPDLWRRGGALRIPLLFSSEGAKLIQIIGYQLPRAILNRSAGQAARVVLAVTIGAMLMRAITHGAPDDDDDETWATWIGNAMFEYNIGGLPVVGNMALQRWNGGYYGAGSSLAQPLLDVMDAVKDFSKDWDERKNSGYTNFESGMLRLMSGVGIASGRVPMGFIRPLYNALTSARDPWQAIQIMTGNQRVKEKALKERE